MPSNVVFFSAVISAATAVFVAAITSILSRKRELEADWRKLKLSQYHELILSMSGIVDERSSSEAQKRYADAVNSMSLVAPAAVLQKLLDFQKETSFKNNIRTQQAHDKLFNNLLRAMRSDVYPPYQRKSHVDVALVGVPPEPISKSAPASR